MQRLSTRLLLTCAAIGVGGGLVFVVSGYIGGTISATAPVLYGLIIGVYFLPGVVAQALLRRGGTALMTGLTAGLVSAAFSPQWFFRYFGTGLAIGLLQELPFALSRYRVWKSWVFFLAAGVAGVLFGASVLVALGLEHFAPLAQIVYIALFVLSPVAFTAIGRGVAAALARAGVGRSISLPVDRRSTRADSNA
ncbi:MAG TPA: ECF transporter S component [Plantibacter sp.]|uniref:ECF transporter S component n=1 Tax=unclassified Plantibacter TaxID=2624265 RepID=UPI002C33A981|nr:ECF transporter S component [Plantibacter sp.]